MAPILQARILVRLGEFEAALDGLEQALSERNSMMFSLATAQEFDVLRAEARFQALLRRLGLDAIPAAP